MDSPPSSPLLGDGDGDDVTSGPGDGANSSGRGVVRSDGVERDETKPEQKVTFAVEKSATSQGQLKKLS